VLGGQRATEGRRVLDDEGVASVETVTGPHPPEYTSGRNSDFEVTISTGDRVTLARAWIIAANDVCKETHAAPSVTSTCNHASSALRGTRTARCGPAGCTAGIEPSAIQRRTVGADTPRIVATSATEKNEETGKSTSLICRQILLNVQDITQLTVG
jgi:hypothetical protein